MTILFCLLLRLPLRGAEPDVRWQAIGGDADPYDTMMERAAFLDVPRRDLMNMARGFPVAPSASCPRQSAARGCFWRSWVLYKENPDSAVELSRMALNMCDSARYPYDHARFSLMRADVMRLHGHFAEAYAIYRDKLELLRRYGDRMWQAKVHVAIGVIMQELGEYHEAMRHFQEGQQIFRTIGSEACFTKNRINIANLHYLLDNKEEALHTLQGLEENPFVKADSIYLANLLVSRFRISDCADSLAVIRAHDISRRLSNDHLLALTLRSLGWLRYMQRNYKESMTLLREGLGIAERLEDFSSRREVLSALEECSRALGMPAEAGIYHDRWREINDSLYHHERNDRIRRAEHLATINRYERRIAEEAQAARWRQTMLVAVAAFLAVILVLSLLLMWMWRRRTESERRLKMEENERLTLLNRQYSLEIEAKEKELASNTLLMAQKNMQLKDLSRQIERLEGEGLATGHTDPLKQTISEQLSADDDWRYFKLRFEKVHPGFFEALRERCPALSKTELRLCAYIRVGMTAKEIAQVLSVKPDTVNTSRYRIRKKLALVPEASLESALEGVR
ncbi:MAG: LuxR C-terminal-related transcriptional regulator [Muribaculaceae bacterium]|nr:LuxR C-terminal-related transcriptional regulator [Muribaculaceae bacterium]